MPKEASKVVRRNGNWSSEDAKQFEEQAKVFTEKVTASPEAALAYLKQLGVLTPKGRLSSKYGG